MRSILPLLALLAAPLALPAAAAPLHHQAAPSSPLHQADRFTVEMLGEPKAPDLILIPGLSSTREVWRATADHYARTHRVHLVQLRGFGDDAGANVTGAVLDPFVTELAAYAATLKRPVVVGHSMGGLSAMLLGLKAPAAVHRIIVVDALPFIGTLFGAADVAAVRPQAERMRAMMATMPVVAEPFPRADCPVSLPAPDKPQGNLSNSGVGLCHVAHGLRTSDPRVVGQVMSEVMTTDLREAVATLQPPLTVFYAQDDRLLPSDRITAIYRTAYAKAKGATLVEIPRSYHFIMLDQPAAFRAALDRALVTR